MPPRRALVSIGMLLALVSALATPAPAQAGAGDRLYYVSLGTSLSVGVQPDRDSVNRDRTKEAYSDQLYAALLTAVPNLELKKLGCDTEETTTHMIMGGFCAYDEGSQLAEAVSFLTAHRDSLLLVTIDMGVNDVRPCASLDGIDPDCVAKGFYDIGQNLPVILTTLREAAGPDVPIVAMNYYNPFLAAWLLGPEGQALAVASSNGQALLNALLKVIYDDHHIPVADVAAAFRSYDFTLVPVEGVGAIPINVLIVCQLTWMCAPPPVGPNIHANADGYGVIAGAFLAVLP